VCKLAVEQGWVLVLVEETVNDDASPWCFAVDTVISLKVTEEGRREARVMKHRFGSCQPGPHRLLVEREGVRVLPCFAAYRNAVRDLALPEPTTNRSLRLPLIATVPDWTSFDLSDQQGFIVVVDVDPSPNQGAVEEFVAAIGATARDGSSMTGARLSVELSESHGRALRRTGDGFHFGSLHQMVDGEEWLESALSHVAAIKTPLARVIIGPTNRLNTYEHSETLQKAISILSTILDRCGLLVVVYGKGSNDSIRAAIVGEAWSVAPATNPPTKRRKVERLTSSGQSQFEVAIS
jgi:hypothetical protein